MKVLLLGENGQLGWELSRSCPRDVVLAACDFPKVDFFSSKSIASCINKEKPDCIINAAAYTAVDQAEKEPEKADRINHTAVAEIARLAEKSNLFMVHVSTDYVFNGRYFSPISPGETPDPRSVYGRTKLAGEMVVSQLLPEQSAIIRTAWLYSANGNNFVKTMVRLMREKDSLNVVDDQVGTPTWANGLAAAIWSVVQQKTNGLYHWTDAGVASWYDFAVAIQEEALSNGQLDKAIPVLPIPSSAYPTPAERPSYSVLDSRDLYNSSGIVPVHWRKQLRNMLKECDL